jgi:hypothetical protein
MFKGISICKPGEKISRIGEVIEYVYLGILIFYIGNMLRVRDIQSAKNSVAMG